jgi:hypothetical protein
VRLGGVIFVGLGTWDTVGDTVARWSGTESLALTECEIQPEGQVVLAQLVQGRRDFATDLLPSGVRFAAGAHVWVWLLLRHGVAIARRWECPPLSPIARSGGLGHHDCVHDRATARA